MNITWSIKPFNELSLQDFHDVLKLRVDVFVVEQKCPYAEVDGKDPDALHVIGRDAHGGVIAYARILPPHVTEPPHIGRIAVSKEGRSSGLGKSVMTHALQAIRKHYGTERSALAAQSHLEGFYRQFGYVRQGPDYDWDGIPHVDMLRDL